MSTKIITPKATLSYPHLAEPQKAEDGKKPKYSCALVFEPGTDLSAMRAAAIEAGQAKFGNSFKVGTGPKQRTITFEEALDLGLFRSPFRTDAEAKGYPEGSVFVNVRTETKPQCVRADVSRIADEDIKETLYPGCIVKASLNAFGYENSGNKGVSFGLNNIQKIADGERLDSRVAAEAEFEPDLSGVPEDLTALMGNG